MVTILNIFNNFYLGIGDWGLGIGDWGLGIGPNPQSQSPIPNPQSPIPIFFRQNWINNIKNIFIFNLMEFLYQKAKSLEERKAEFQNVMHSNPGKIAIICEKDPKSKIVNIEKSKFLISSDVSLSQFSLMIRKRLKLGKEEALFFLVNGKKSLTGDDTMQEVYDKYKQEDGFLYIAYASELIWG